MRIVKFRVCKAGGMIKGKCIVFSCQEFYKSKAHYFEYIVMCESCSHDEKKNNEGDSYILLGKMQGTDKYKGQ